MMSVTPICWRQAVGWMCATVTASAPGCADAAAPVADAPTAAAAVAPATGAAPQVVVAAGDEDSGEEEICVLMDALSEADGAVHGRRCGSLKVLDTSHWQQSHASRRLQSTFSSLESTLPDPRNKSTAPHHLDCTHITTTCEDGSIAVHLGDRF